MKWYKSVIFIACLCLLTNNAYALDVSGYVTESGTGLSGVSMSDNFSIDTTTTNATGYYIMSGYSDNASYLITATFTGYRTNSTIANTTALGVTDADIILTKTNLYSMLTDLDNIVTSITAMFIAIMALFMEPPLVIFVGIILFVFILGMLGKYKIFAIKP